MLHSMYDQVIVVSFRVYYRHIFEWRFSESQHGMSFWMADLGTEHFKPKFSLPKFQGM